MFAIPTQDVTSGWLSSSGDFFQMNERLIPDGANGVERPPPGLARVKGGRRVRDTQLRVCLDAPIRCDRRI
jgi:hypothetical protein